MIVDQDLLVQARFRNAVLWEKMAGRTAAEVCREIGVGQSEFGAYLNLKDSPISAKGGYRPGAQKIADHFRMLPEDLFPASLYALTLPKTFERTYSSEAVLLSLGCSEARQLTTGDDMDEKLDMESLHEHVQQVLGTLRAREEKIITMRFGLDGNGEHTLEEVGRVFNVTRDRIRQLEARALRKLRHPACSQELRPFIEGLD